MSSSRLVSIVIPAYKAAFFEAALASALRQNHDEIEILVCDDCPTDAIKQIVDKLSPGSRWPIRYLRNPVPLGEMNNIAHGVEQSRGDYIKFLYDDDLLLPDCTRLLFAALHENPDIKLASATRKRIDANGSLLPDNLFTLNPFGRNVVLNGPDLVSFLAQHPVNFIGEPSSVMCRREDVLAFGQDIMSLKQTVIIGLGDVALYLKLLRHGNLALLARPLSYFRVSELQGSEILRSNPNMSRDGHDNHYRLTQELGWKRPDNLNDKVRIAPLAQRDAVQLLDLRSYFDKRPEATRRNTLVSDWLSNRKPSAAEHGLLNEYLLNHHDGPSIAIIVSDFNNQPEHVLSTLQSLTPTSALLQRLKVFILADYDSTAQTALQAQLPWMHADLESRPTVINDLMQANDHEWWMLVDAGTRFTDSGLLFAAMNLIDMPQACALFGDEVILDAQQGASLLLRPDFSLDFLLACPSLNSKHWLFNRSKALAVGGFDPRLTNALELDLILRMIEDADFSGFGHSSEPLVIAPAHEPQDNYDEARAVQRHVQARGYDNSEVSCPEPGRYRITYGHVEQPLVSILIVCQDQSDNLIPCIESILELTRYPHYEIVIVDNGSQRPETVQWLANIDAMQSDRLRVVRHEQVHDHSTLINRTAEQAKGEYLLLMDSAVTIIDEQWLHNLLNHAQRPEIGVTGAKVISPDGQPMHSGLVLGVHGTAADASCTQASCTSFGQRLKTEQNYSAVSKTCLLVRKSVYDAVGGLDAQLFHEHFSEIDLCLKARESGYLTVWTPYAVVMSRAATAPADAQLLDFATRALHHKWLHYLAWDPAYNKNLALQDKPFSAQTDHSLSWRPLLHRPLPVVLVQPLDRGRQGSRLSAPLEVLREQAELDVIICHTPLLLPELARLSPDNVILQGSAGLDDRLRISEIKNHTNAQVIYDLCMLDAAVSEDDHTRILASLRDNLAEADIVTVPTLTMAGLLAPVHPDIRVIETRLAPATWPALKTHRTGARKPRVGWVGTPSQAADLELLSSVIKALANEIHWVVMGPCSRWLRPYIHELHACADDSLYPGLLADLNLDLVVLPARSSSEATPEYTDAMLEFGICGYPIICSEGIDSHHLPVTQVKNESAAWIEAIRARISQPDVCTQHGLDLKRAVAEHWMIDESGLAKWRNALNEKQAS